MTAFKKISIPAIFTKFQSQIRPLDRDMLSSTDELVLNLDSILNGGISFTDNVDCVLIDFTSNAVINTQDAVAHTLGKIPTGYIVCNQDKAGSLYAGGTAWTSSNIYLKCSVASVAFKILVF